MLVPLVAFLFIGSLHIPFSSGIYFIPIKSIDILNVTNCDRFWEAAIISNVTVTPTETLTVPKVGKDSDTGRAQTVSISFTNDVALDENAVVTISDMKPDRISSYQNSNVPIKWIRNKVYLNRHNLCDVLNNYLAKAILGNNNNKIQEESSNTPRGAYNVDVDTNNVESHNERSGTVEAKQRHPNFCPIPAGHYTLPRFKWKTPKISVPAIFLGYQKYMIEFIKPALDDKSDTLYDILMCKVVTVFLHPRKDY